jgi:AcrR family transcriptional regulator
MTYPAYVREKARKLRLEKHLSIDEIAERLALPKTTIYYWVRDVPLGRPRRANPGQRKGNRQMGAKYRLRRMVAYAQGRLDFARFARDPTFRDFICLYMAEGYKRSRNTVAVCNSDPAIVLLCARWVRHFARNPVKYSVQYHADQELDELQRFWADHLAVAPEEIRLQRKSNSGRLSGRTWRSRYGVLNVCANDTIFRARLQAWIDCLQEQWLDSGETPGRSSVW